MNNLYLYGYYIFRIQRAIKFGDAVYVYGSSSQLGDWKIENAKRLELFDNNLWLSQLYLEKKHYEYKFFISNYNKPNNSNFTLIDDKGSAFTIEPEHLLSKNSGITMLINDHCESDIEKYSPDFIINNEKKKLFKNYEIISFERSIIGFKNQLFYLIDNGCINNNPNIVRWGKVNKYENILIKVDKCYFLFDIQINNGDLEKLNNCIEKIIEQNNETNIPQNEEIKKEEEVKTIILLVSISHYNEELSEKVINFFTSKNYSSCENDQLLKSKNNNNKNMNNLSNTDKIIYVFYKVKGSHEIEFCKKYQNIIFNDDKLENGIYINFTFN